MRAVFWELSQRKRLQNLRLNLDPLASKSLARSYTSIMADRLDAVSSTANEANLADLRKNAHIDTIVRPPHAQMTHRPETKVPTMRSTSPTGTGTGLSMLEPRSSGSISSSVPKNIAPRRTGSQWIHNPSDHGNMGTTKQDNSANGPIVLTQHQRPDVSRNKTPQYRGRTRPSVAY